jgi:hypothetical protein
MCCADDTTYYTEDLLLVVTFWVLRDYDRKILYFGPLETYLQQSSVRYRTYQSSMHEKRGMMIVSSITSNEI